MKKAPILFSGPMIRAILEGRKIQTRRHVLSNRKEEMACWVNDHSDQFSLFGVFSGTNQFSAKLFLHEKYINKEGLFAVLMGKSYGVIEKCRYEPGTVLWVGETWRPTMHPFPIGPRWDYKATAEDDGVPLEGPWKPSIFMPLEASRIKLLVKAVS